MLQFRAAVDGFRVVVVDGFLDVDRFHHVVLLGVHADAVDAVDVEDGDVEPRLLVVVRPFQFVENPLADGVVLVLDRGVEPAVVGVERHAAQVAGHALDAAEQVALKVGFEQRRGEGEIHMAAVGIDGNALHVERALFARVDFAGEGCDVDRFFVVRCSRRTSREQRQEEQNGKESFEIHAVSC